MVDGEWNDKAVLTLRYELTPWAEGQTDGVLSINVAAQQETVDVFDCRIQGTTLEARPTRELTETVARERLEPLLGEWAVEIGDKRGVAVYFRQAGVDFVKGRAGPWSEGHTVTLPGAVPVEIVDLPPPPPPVLPATAEDGRAVLESRLRRISETPLLSMEDRLARYRQGSEPLAAFAYYMLTVLEGTYGAGPGKGGARRKAAQALNVREDLLSTLGRLTAEKGGRKHQASASDYSPSEVAFISQAIAILMERARVKEELDADGRGSQLTSTHQWGVADLPGI